jgi:hypothetical protein
MDKCFAFEHRKPTIKAAKKGQTHTKKTTSVQGPDNIQTIKAEKKQ